MALRAHMFRKLTIRRSEGDGSPADVSVATRDQLPVGREDWDKVEVADTGEVFMWCSNKERWMELRDGSAPPHTSGFAYGKEHVVPRGLVGAWIKSDYDNRWELIATSRYVADVVAVCDTRAEARSMRDLLVEAVRMMGGDVRTD